MNDSGFAVQALMDYYKLSINEVMVIHDEIDLMPGTTRLKQDGGHGGHNGLRDIIQRTGRSEFLRLRIGVGHPGSKDKVVTICPRTSECRRRKKNNRLLFFDFRYESRIVSG